MLQHASDVLEDAFVLYADDATRSALVEEFYGREFALWKVGAALRPDKLRGLWYGYFR